MRTLCLRLTVALFTFSISLVLTWIWPFGRPQPHVVVTVAVDVPAPEASRVDGAAYIKFRQFSESAGGAIYAEFNLANESHKDVYYEGPGQSSPCAIRFKGRNRIYWKQVPNCECGLAWQPQIIAPGESTIIKVDVSGEKGAFQVGLEAKEYQGERPLALWSEKLKLPKDK